ncbi:MAG: hypothetical protein KDC92_05060 [Bacteroidetes bacterium]|nr:hypothetical protein [Bacteroidota bacterium]
MLASTQALFRLLSFQEALNHELISVHVKVVCKLGSAIDANAILNWMQEQSNLKYVSHLLPVLTKHGTTKHALELYHLSVVNGEMKPDAPEELMAYWGKVGLQSAVSLLAATAFNKQSDHYQIKCSVLGLVHLNTHDYEPKIEAALEACYGRALFAEYHPALVAKLPNRVSHFKRMFELGEEIASTDCNGGLLLGFALSGAEGKPWLKRALYSQAWDSFDYGTGTVYASYKAIKFAQIPLLELYHDLAMVDAQNSQQLAYQLGLLLAMLSLRLQDVDHEPLESVLELYQGLFNQHEAQTRNIWEMTENDKQIQELHSLNHLMLAQIESELLMNNLKV